MKRTLLITAAVLGLSISGCNVLRWTMYMIAPASKVDAVYKMPKGKYLVFVDDIHISAPYEPIREQLTRRLGQQMIQHELGGQIVPYEQLQNYIACTSDFNRMSIPAVGKALGADKVLYVAIREFSVKEDGGGNLWRGNLKLELKVVDVNEGRLWPSDADSFELPAIQTPLETNPSPHHGVEITSMLADKAADRIAKLFYKHEVGFGQEEDMPQAAK